MKYCSKLNWSSISPAIFGAMFQGVMNPEERRKLGAHYTSEENIQKVIKPLFMDELREEFERIKVNNEQLKFFHEKLSRLKFLDPACGCGNFLIITYKELRLLELEVLKMLIDTNIQMEDIPKYCKVNVSQFFGIELEEFPSQIAQVGLWLIDHQMNTIVAKEFGYPFDRLPLRLSATIVHGNALNMEWDSIISKKDLNYILGNPPFVGYSNQTRKQKEELVKVFLDKNGKPIKNSGKIDYVAGWYYKAAQYIQGTHIRVAFVSTNSIVQGEQVATIWGTMIEMFHIVINFAYRTFIWSNEAKGKAAVHCVIIGFSLYNNERKIIFDGDKAETAKNINPYLINAPNILIGSKSDPICDVPKIIYGSKPVDGKHLIIKENEYDEFIKQEPISKKYIRPLIGADEFIKNKKRWCLWLVNAEPSDIKKMRMVQERIELVKKFRSLSPKKATQKSASTPSLFMEIRQPDSDYIIIPGHSKGERDYIPIGFMSKETIVTNAVNTIPNATLYHFGVLTSKIHMAWVNMICGRIKSDYRYSIDIVYNNFPWPNPTERQKKEIEEAAQKVLDARSLYSKSSLADLYDPLIMSSATELIKEHNNLDKAVLNAYGFRGLKTETAIITHLVERYLKITNEGAREYKYEDFSENEHGLLKSFEYGIGNPPFNVADIQNDSFGLEDSRSF